MMRILQVTLTSAATQISANSNIYCSLLIIQDNAAALVRVGDNTVSGTKGIVLLPNATPPGGGSITSQPLIIRGTHLQDWWLFGTAGNIIDILYETAT